jgi:hypothetical protein
LHGARINSEAASNTCGRQNLVTVLTAWTFNDERFKDEHSPHKVEKSGAADAAIAGAVFRITSPRLSLNGHLT